MINLLTSTPLLTVFLVVALGTMLGMIPFGPIRLGAAGALFVGLVIGNAVPEMGGHLALIQSLGLALFVYTVGLSAGQTFFRDLRRQAGMMGAVVLILFAVGAVSLGVGKILGLKADLTAGVYAGSLTTTPALAAATDAARGSGGPGVGYSLGYPVGVIAAILLVSAIVSRSWKGANDVPSLAGRSLYAGTAKVAKNMFVRDVPGWKEQNFRISYLKRNGNTRVFVPGEELLAGDQVVVVGMRGDVKAAINFIGEKVSRHLADDRAHVDFRQFVVSSKTLAGQTVAALNMTGKFGAVVTRIHRGDLELLATDDSTIEIGDRLMVAYPRAEYNRIENFLGNSEQKISQIDAISMGVGMALGLLLGLVKISLGAGATFSLGAAAGPLVVGMILGALQKTGPFLWQMPQAANQTIRQLGLILFLAAVGISSGPDFMKTAFTGIGLKAGAVAVAVAFGVLGLTIAAGALLGVSAQRTAGIMAGMLGQPAILAFAMGRENDERIEQGYAAVFALGIIVKIIVATLIVVLFTG